MISKKIKAIFLCFLVISLTIITSISLSSYRVSSFSFVNAQQYGWCLETNNGKTCQLTYNTECKGGVVYTSRPPQCNPVTCILPDGKCEENVPRYTCIQEYKGSEDTKNLCVRGCCGVAGRGYGIKTYAECLNIAQEKGYDESYIEWYGGLTDERECSLKFSKEDVGCCVPSCKFVTRRECQGDFYKDTYCSQLSGLCYVQHHFKLGCGVMPGDEDKICWFDNLGNQEECIHTCEYPAFTCAINNVQGYILKDKEIGYNWSKGKEPTLVKSNQLIQVFGVYCKSTSCDLSGSKGRQKLEWDGRRELKISFEPPPSKNLLSGHSICYNFYGRNTTPVENNKFPERSTGLQNQILRCVNGEVILEGLGVDRKVLCFEANNFSTYVEENKYEKCINPRCGGEGAADVIHDFFMAGVRGTYGVGFYGLPFAMLAKAIGGKDVGICSKDECDKNRGSFHSGESYCVWRSEVRGPHLDTACVPRYPPGTTELCGKCRSTGDNIFNFCEKSEAFALGNCEFNPYSPMEGSLQFFLTFWLLTLSMWFGLIPIAAVIDAIIECGVPGFIGCTPGKIIQHTKNLVVIMFKVLSLVFVGGIVGTFKEILQQFGINIDTSTETSQQPPPTGSQGAGNQGTGGGSGQGQGTGGGGEKQTPGTGPKKE